MKECPHCKRTFPDHITHCPADGAETTLSIVGSTLDGQYHIESLLGKGGMGAVYRARHILLNDKVAIRILPPQMRNNAEWLRRFRREGLAARRFRHPNAVTIYDLRTTSEGLIYHVMEFVEGHTLEVELKRSGRLTPQQAFSILEPIISMLNAVHAMGIVHGDLKPENIMLLDNTPLPEGIKVLDFGLAKIKFSELLGSSKAAETRGLMGSSFYMAPELWSGEEPDARTDIYSLGVILYQMLAGDVPFKGSSISATMKKHLTSEPPALSVLHADVPTEVERVVLHALAKDPDLRPQTVEEFIGEMREVLTRVRLKQIDETVQFTVYRPRAVEPEKWYPLLAYVHLSEFPLDAPPNFPSPKEEVEEEARKTLGDKFPAYTDTAADSRQAIPKEGILTFQPVFEGMRFVPEHHTLLWVGPMHELKFDMKAARALEGQTARGYLRVYLGLILVAEVPLAIPVDTQKALKYGNAPTEPEPPPPHYRKIFASYSHSDEPVVEQFEQLAKAFGDEYLRDVRDIRAGEEWGARLEELIRVADIFQLFWSKNSMHSKFVQAEWKYALSLNRANFIKPTFWEEPMPEDKGAGLPPESLRRLQFKRVPSHRGERGVITNPPSVESVTPVTKETTVQTPPTLPNVNAPRADSTVDAVRVKEVHQSRDVEISPHARLRLPSNANEPRADSTVDAIRVKEVGQSRDVKISRPARSRLPFIIGMLILLVLALTGLLVWYSSS